MQSRTYLISKANESRIDTSDYICYFCVNRNNGMNDLIDSKRRLSRNCAAFGGEILLESAFTKKPSQRLQFGILKQVLAKYRLRKRPA